MLHKGEVCNLLHQKNRPWSVASKKLFFLMQEVMFHFLLDTIHRHAIGKNGEANLICHVGKHQPL